MMKTFPKMQEAPPHPNESMISRHWWIEGKFHSGSHKMVLSKPNLFANKILMDSLEIIGEKHAESALSQGFGGTCRAT